MLHGEMSYCAQASVSGLLTPQSVQSIMGAMEKRRALETLGNGRSAELEAETVTSRSGRIISRLPTFSSSRYTNVVPGGSRVVPMGTIVARKRKDGSTGYTAQIVIKRGGKIVHRESQTFDRKQAATIWLGKREAQLKEPGGVEQAQRPKATLADVIDRYIREDNRGIGRTKEQVLKAIKAGSLGETDIAQLTSADVVAYARDLAQGRKPQTVANYLSHLQAVLTLARPAWGYDVSPEVMRDAFNSARRLGYTGKSEKRETRPTLDELDAFMRHFLDRETRRPGMVPMTVLVPFALFSTRRMGEILRIEGKDRNGNSILVRDMKNPGEKKGNDVWVDLPDEAAAILDAIGGDGRYFPYGEDAVGANFTRAGNLLGLGHINFHDLRHEGVSRLFEMGWNIPNVAKVSGHRSWASLQRYSHIRQSGDKFKDWPWLAVAVERAKGERT